VVVIGCRLPNLIIEHVLVGSYQEPQLIDRKVTKHAGFF
jgi:hypothetical protein